MTGEARPKDGWEHWARSFYNNLSLNEAGYKEKIAHTMPLDWWERVQKVLKLRPLGE